MLEKTGFKDCPTRILENHEIMLVILFEDIYLLWNKPLSENTISWKAYITRRTERFLFEKYAKYIYVTYIYRAKMK